MIIDAHVHIGNLARARCPWPGPETGSLHRSIDFAEIAPVLAVRGIDAAVLDPARLPGATS